MRINKALAQAGVASRRGVEKLIEEGRITVDGAPASVGQRVDANSEIRVDGKKIALESDDTRRVIVYHKPEGEICTASDPRGRRTVFDSVADWRGARLVCVGRLDINTSGLLLLTTDGELAHRLMHPSHEVVRVYRCRVIGDLKQRDEQRMLAGVDIDGQPAAFLSIERQRSSGGSNTWYTVKLAEGRNREVRKIFEAVGARVNRLIRERYGPVKLESTLKKGHWRELLPKEIESLAGAVALGED